MRWRGRQKSTNVEDRRGRGGAGRTGAGLGIGGVILAVVIYFLGGDPSVVLNQTSPVQYDQNTSSRSTAETDELAEFVQVVLKDTEDVWNKLFRKYANADYREPTLVLFDGTVSSACGRASSATGPFYCPADEKLYIDLSFYGELKNRFGAPGDFAMAYVVAHEVGHHVQNLLGITERLDRIRGRVSKAEYNDQSVRLELQADFFSGVWAHHGQQMKNFLEAGDIEEALRAANAIGDDRLQKQAQGYAVPESFTHGTSAQRMRWFKKGFETGDLNQGDTFGARSL